MATVSFTAKVHDKGLLQLPEEAITLGLEPGDEVEISVRLVLHHGRRKDVERTSTLLEQAKAFRAWAESLPELRRCSQTTLSAERISTENAVNWPIL